MIAGEWFSTVANHLWQSTIFAALAALLTLALRRNHARVRFGLWLIASLKFLLPFSLLVALAGIIGLTGRPRVIEPRITSVVGQVAQPFGEVIQTGLVGPSIRTAPPLASVVLPGVLVVTWCLGVIGVASVWFKRWSRARAVLRNSVPLTDGSELQVLRKLEETLGLRRRVQLSVSHERLEPGVIGLLRPVLLLPAGISEHLSDAQLEAILIHELSHVRRMDNLASAAHLIVETVFWFHPLVWWLEKRLVLERERACDEEVLRFNGDGEAYADAILTICERYLRAPLTCVSGVTGSGLVKRVETILTFRAADHLNGFQKLAVACAAAMAFAVPVAIGVANAGQGLSDSIKVSFETASVKANTSGEQRAYSRLLPGGAFTATNNTLHSLILNAFWIPNYLLSGEPDWAEKERFDIEGKAAAGAIPPGLSDRDRNGYTRRMIQSLLADRFQLLFHRETKEIPIYELVVAKNGPKFQKAPDRDCTTATTVCHSFGPGNPAMVGGFPGTSVDMDDLADLLMRFEDRPILNKTNLKGLYDIRLQWNPLPPGVEPGARNAGERIVNADVATLPTLFTALEEQLGLKLESRKGQVETIVIDHLERPSPN